MKGCAVLAPASQRYGALGMCCGAAGGMPQQATLQHKTQEHVPGLPGAHKKTLQLPVYWVADP